MTTYRSVLAKDQNEEEARKVLQKKYENADISFEEKSDFLGRSWTEAVINV